MKNHPGLSILSLHPQSCLYLSKTGSFAYSLPRAVFPGTIGRQVELEEAVRKGNEKFNTMITEQLMAQEDIRRAAEVEAKVTTEKRLPPAEPRPVYWRRGERERGGGAGRDGALNVCVLRSEKIVAVGNVNIGHCLLTTAVTTQEHVRIHLNVPPIPTAAPSVVAARVGTPRFDFCRT